MGNDPEAEKVGGIRKRCTVRPSLAAMPTLPVCPDGGYGLILHSRETFVIQTGFFSAQIDPGIHHAN
jgi:hypothetical protein